MQLSRIHYNSLYDVSYLLIKNQLLCQTTADIQEQIETMAPIFYLLTKRLAKRGITPMDEPERETQKVREISS